MPCASPSNGEERLDVLFDGRFRDDSLCTLNCSGMSKWGLKGSGVIEMTGPAVMVEEEGHGDGKLIACDGCVELDDMVSNAFRSSIIMGCRFSSSQYAANDSCSDALVWELKVCNGGRRGVDPEDEGAPAGDLGFTTRVCPLSRSSSAVTSGESFRFSRTALACLCRLLTVT